MEGGREGGRAGRREGRRAGKAKKEGPLTRLPVREDTRIEPCEDRGNDGRTEVIIHCHLGRFGDINPSSVLPQGPMHGVKLKSIRSAFLAVNAQAGATRAGFLQGGDAETVELAVWEGIDGLDTDGDWRE